MYDGIFVNFKPFYMTIRKFLSHVYEFWLLEDEEEVYSDFFSYDKDPEETTNVLK